MEVPPTIAGAGVGVSQASGELKGKGITTPTLLAGRLSPLKSQYLICIYVCGAGMGEGSKQRRRERRGLGRKSLEMRFE